MSTRPTLKLEWISLFYLTMFVLAVISPSLVSRDFFGINERHVEEILIFIFGITGLTTFALYQRMMEKKEKENKQVKDELDKMKLELIDSYQYIGSINRQIDLLKRLANLTSKNIIENDRLTKDLIESLLSNAAVAVNAESAFIRYIELDKSRTVLEKFFNSNADKNGFLKIHNKELIKMHESKIPYAFMRTEDGDEILVIPSDNSAKPIKAYLVVSTDPSRTADADVSLLKVFVNQAELLHHTLAVQVKNNNEPLKLIEQTVKSVAGEVE